MVTTMQIAESLRGITFPCSKQHCVEFARSHNASQEVIDTLDRLPDHQFNSVGDVWTALGDIV